MSFIISNIVYACQGNLESSLSNKSNIITSVVDLTLIAGASIIGGLMLGGKLNFGLPMGVGTIGNYLAWGCVGVGGGIIIADIIIAIIIKNRKVTNAEVSVQCQELHFFLFSTLISSRNINNVQPLELLLPDINKFLMHFNLKYSLNLKAIGSQHSSQEQDPWQTIKIIDLSIKTEGQVSNFLNELNDYLHVNYGIISNGGDSKSVKRGQKKHPPVCFIKSEVVMHPQIQISLMDIKRILGITSKTKYFQELQNAYIPRSKTRT